MDSPRVEKKDIAPSLKRPIDETVSTLVTYALIVNTLSSFGIKIEDPRDYVKFFPSTLNRSVTSGNLPFRVIARSETTKQSQFSKAEIASLRSQ